MDNIDNIHFLETSEQASLIEHGAFLNLDESDVLKEKDLRDIHGTLHQLTNLLTTCISRDYFYMTTSVRHCL